MDAQQSPNFVQKVKNTSTIFRFSLQNEEEYLSYQMVNVPAYTYMNNNYNPEEDIINHISSIPQWSRDQYGSRTVQNVLENGS